MQSLPLMSPTLTLLSCHLPLPFSHVTYPYPSLMSPTLTLVISCLRFDHPATTIPSQCHPPLDPPLLYVLTDPSSPLHERNHTHTHTYIHTYIYIHTYMHTYIHTVSHFKPPPPPHSTPSYRTLALAPTRCRCDSATHRSCTHRTALRV